MATSGVAPGWYAHLGTGVDDACPIKAHSVKQSFKTTQIAMVFGPTWIQTAASATSTKCGRDTNHRLSVTSENNRTQ